MKQGSLRFMLVAFILLCSAVFLSGCGDSDLPGDAAASINGIILSKDAVEARIDYQNKMFPGMVQREDKVNFPKIRQQTTRDMVLAELDRQELERRGLAVSQEEVIEALQLMADDAYFGDINRMFDDYATKGVSRQELGQVTLERLMDEKLSADVGKDIQPSESDIQEFYQRNLQLYSQSEMRQTRVIVTSSEAAARDAAARIGAGESFVTVAQQVSIDPAAATNGGNMGLISRGRLPSEADSVLFGMNVGDVAGPVSAGGQWYILRLEGIQQGQPVAVDEAKQQIRVALTKEAQAARFKALKDELYSSADIKYDPEYDPKI